MHTPAFKDNHELNPLVFEIVRLASEGLSDSQIGRMLGKTRVTILSYRRKYGIPAGVKVCRAVPKQTQSSAKREFPPLSELIL